MVMLVIQWLMSVQYHVEKNTVQFDEWPLLIKVQGFGGGQHEAVISDVSVSGSSVGAWGISDKMDKDLVSLSLDLCLDLKL